MLRVVREGRQQERSFVAALTDTPSPRAMFRSLLLTACGLAMLIAGAHLTVAAAASLAQLAGVSEFVIGFTAVALGTSLPELATSSVAAVRGEGDVAVGNIVGSNIFNTLAILGTAALVRPMALERTLFAFELPVMLLFSLLILPIAWSGLHVARREGAFLLASYGALVLVLILRATP